MTGALRSQGSGEVPGHRPTAVDGGPPSGHAAAWRGISAVLTAEITSGVYPLGSHFPTEAELQDRFRVGRHSIREALGLMTEQGLIARRRKTGSLVLRTEPLSCQPHNFWEMGEAPSFPDPTTLNIRHQGFMVAPIAEKLIFLPDPGRRWLRIAGLRSMKSDGRPLCWAEIFVPDIYVSDREALLSASGPIHRLVIDANSLKRSHVEQEVGATTLEPTMAETLDSEPGSPAVFVKRRYVAQTGDTYEISCSLYPADRFTVRSVLRQNA